MSAGQKQADSSPERAPGLSRQVLVIGEKEEWGNGFGTEALKLLLDYGFTILSLNSINLWVKEYNRRAKKAYKKVGFKRAGKLRDYWFINDKYYDNEIMDIKQEEFYESHESVIEENYLDF